MRKVDSMSVAERAIAQIKNGAFLTVTAGKEMNTMTIGWALIGFLWKKPVLTVAVRKSRHTFHIIDKAEDFTVSIPSGSMQKELSFCGTKSGRDVDKYKACNLRSAAAGRVHSPIIDTAGIHFECKIVFKSPVNPEFLIQEYHGIYQEGDYHTLYFGEIMDCYERD